jgi:hypothetical protein
MEDMTLVPMCLRVAGPSLTLTTSTLVLSAGPTWRQSWSACGRSTARALSHGKSLLSCFALSWSFTALAIADLSSGTLNLAAKCHHHCSSNQSRSDSGSITQHDACGVPEQEVLLLLWSAGCRTCEHPSLPGSAGPGLMPAPASITSRRLSAPHCSHQPSCTLRAGRIQSQT